MNILFVVPYAPTSIRTRPHNLLRTLVRRGHTTTLATIWENEQERAALRELESQGIRVIAARLTKPRSGWNCLGGSRPACLSNPSTAGSRSWRPAYSQQSTVGSMTSFTSSTSAAPVTPSSFSEAGGDPAPLAGQSLISNLQFLAPNFQSLISILQSSGTASTASHISFSKPRTAAAAGSDVWSHALSCRARGNTKPGS